MSTIGREDVQKARQQLLEEQHRCLEMINRLSGAIAFADQLLAKFDEVDPPKSPREASDRAQEELNAALPDLASPIEAVPVYPV